MTHRERFESLGIRPPKGVLLYGPPGTGKTLMARACAAQTNATYLKLAGPQLVQMFIGDGAKLVRDAFQLAKEKAPCIIFIDEIDAIGTKRFDRYHPLCYTPPAGVLLSVFLSAASPCLPSHGLDQLPVVALRCLAEQGLGSGRSALGHFLVLESLFYFSFSGSAVIVCPISVSHCFSFLPGNAVR